MFTPIILEHWLLDFVQSYGNVMEFLPVDMQVQATYKRKVWECHPDQFPVHGKSFSGSKFKLISEAYRCLQSGNCSYFHIQGNVKTYSKQNRGLQTPKCLEKVSQLTHFSVIGLNAYRLEE